jgi:hypothetical protein
MRSAHGVLTKEHQDARHARRDRLPAHTTAACPRFRLAKAPSRRGAVLLLTVLAIAFAMIAGLVFLAGSSTAVGLAAIVDEKAQARQRAESAVALVLAYMRQTPDWRQRQPSGTWTEALDVLDGSVRVSVLFPQPVSGTVTVVDPSFELDTASIPTPLLNPPMSGVVGGWTFDRTALVGTGPTVPRMGTQTSTSSTEGANQAFASFTASVQGGVVIGQTLAESLVPNNVYELSADIEVAGLGPMDSQIGLRLLANGVLIASSSNATTLTDGLSAEAVQEAAQNVQGAAREPATFVTQLLAGSTHQGTLRFLTDDIPPAGTLRIELFAGATAVLQTVGFDNVRLTRQDNQPSTIAVTATQGEAAHQITASIRYDLTGSARIAAWTEP